MSIWIKRILTLLTAFSISILLSGCGSTNNNGGGKLKPYDSGEFTIQMDPTWKVVNKSEFGTEIPQETIVAFSSPEAYNGFFINVNVVKEVLKSNVTSLDYARANMNTSARNLTDYKKINEMSVELPTEKTLVHVFEARLNPSEKLIRFIQLYATKANTGYIVTGGLPVDTPAEIRDSVGAMVTSFRLK